MEQFKEAIHNFTDEQLYEQYSHHRDEYLPEVQKLLDAEVDRRQLISNKNITEKREEIETIHLDSKDFKPFEHVFNKIDLQLAAAILRENGIVFFVDNPHSTDTIPIENEAFQTYTLHVHESVINKAHTLLDEHFEKREGKYVLKNMSAREQLKSFNFHDLHLSEKEAAEFVNVAFTSDEKTVIARFGRKILDECEHIESSQDRVLFYYDSIEEVLAHLSEDDEQSLNRTELLTILEILQIFVDDPDFPSFMDDAVATLLSFFMN